MGGELGNHIVTVWGNKKYPGREKADMVLISKPANGKKSIDP